MATLAELLISGYSRELQRSLRIHVPRDIVVILMMFYPSCIEFEDNTMNLTLKQKEMITLWFMNIFDLNNKSSILSSKLLYDYNKDGKTGRDFHKKCDGNTNTFTIVQTQFNGHIFGCFLSEKLFTPKSWGEYLADDKAFLCVIKSCFKGKGPELFKIISSDTAYYNVPSWGPAFGSEDLHLLDSYNKCDCKHEWTEFEGDGLKGNVLCGGIKYDERNILYDFKIQEMNTFTIKIDE